MAHTVELVYVPKDLPAVQLSFPYFAGMTVAYVLQQAGLDSKYPEAPGLAVGIFSQRVPLTHVVQPGDRIELYRPLISCPKEKRRTRAGK